MVFEEIRPRTKERQIEMLQALSHVQSLEEAKSKLPGKIFEYIETETQTKKVTFSDIVEAIKTQLNNMKYIKIYVPFEPSSAFSLKIVELFSSNPILCVEILEDHSILGGVKLVYDGRIYDESLNTILENRLQELNNVP